MAAPPDKSRYRPPRAVLALSLLFLTCWWVMDRWYAHQLQVNAHFELSRNLAVTGDLLTVELTNHLAAIEALAAYAMAHASTDQPIAMDEFYIFAMGITRTAPHIRNMTLAPQGVHTFIYPDVVRPTPLKGYNLLEDSRPNVKRDIRRTMQTGKTALSGPYTLRQGGLGFIARKAIYSEGHFWGLATLVIDLPEILKHLEPKGTNGVPTFSLRNHDGDVFFGEPQHTETQAQQFTVPLPEGFWTLSATQSDTLKSHQQLFFRIISFLIWIFLCGTSSLLVIYQNRLKQEVNEHATSLQIAYQALEQKHETLKKRERELYQAKKMEALGTFAGGIAHEFNNLLAIIIGNTELLTEERGDSEDIKRERLKKIYESCLRGKKIVGQLVNFTQCSLETLSQKSLQEILGNATSLIEQNLPATIALHVHTPDEPLMVQADAILLQKALINIFHNALHAMDDKMGELTVFLFHKNQDTLKNMAWLPDHLKNNPSAIIRVHDTGHGMSQPVCERIFEPFYSTNDPTYGTGGLGLAVVHGIIQSHNGAIRVESQPEKGSTFTICLPLAQEHPEPKSSPHPVES